VSRKHLVVAVLAVGLVALTGCVVSSPPDLPTTSSGRVLPEGTADYQLGGAYEAAAGVSIVVRDATEAADPDRYSICYINGFQTQPSERDAWMTNHPELVLRGAEGEPVIDANWPDEMLLDTSTPQNREAIAAIHGATLEGCLGSSYSAVEFDNLDSYLRSDSALTEDDNIALATLMVDRAHELGLVAGQKNAVELAERGRDEVGFDFAVTEECAVFDECAGYTDVYGPEVIAIEYSDDVTLQRFAEICADPATPQKTILRDRDLVTAGSPEYVFAAC